jgi:hypothetical protein
VSRRLSQSESAQFVDTASTQPSSPQPDPCSPFVDQLPISGVSISVFDDDGRQSTICASDATAARLDELQFELREGPHWEALESATPVLLPDTRGTTPVASIAFGEAILNLPVGALFTFPMTMGAVTVGVVELYRSTAGELDEEALKLAASLTKLATIPAVSDALRTAASDVESVSHETPAMRREVHQATGMILVQLGVSATEAFARLRAHAFAVQRPIRAVARDVVDRTLDFRDLAP